MMEEGSVEYAMFAVVDRPICVWAPDLEAENLRFLRGLDPRFFLYQAQIHGAALRGAKGSDETRRHAALALRIAYGMGLETLFGLLGAVMQAPHCVFGWLNTYRNADLEKFVEKIENNEAVKALPPFVSVSWGQIAAIILTPDEKCDRERFEPQVAMFARAWKTFARTFVSEQSRREYNSLKHSFRVEPCPLVVSMTHEGRSLLESETQFGTNFPYLKPVEGKKRHHCVGWAAVTLEPDVYICALMIIALSLKNVLAFARHRAGDTSKLSLSFFNDGAVFEGLWKHRTAVSSVTYGTSVSVSEEKYWSDAEILAVYDPPNTGEE